MYNAEKLTSIDLGRQGENLARTVEIDVSSMLAQWPDAAITLLVKRKHDAEPYIADTTVKDGVLFWPITTVETADAGDGKLEIRATCGEVIAKSATGTFRVTASLTGSGTEPPASEQGWVDKVIAAGAGVEQSASQASKAADRAELAAETAENSIAQIQSAAQTVTEKAKEAQSSAEAASAASTDAVGSAQAARKAQAGAEESKTSAAGSASLAEQAKAAAEAAQKTTQQHAKEAEAFAQSAEITVQQTQTTTATLQQSVDRIVLDVQSIGKTVLLPYSENLFTGVKNYAYTSSTFSGWISSWVMGREMFISILKCAITGRGSTVTKVRVRIALDACSDATVVLDEMLEVNIPDGEEQEISCAVPMLHVKSGQTVYVAVEANAICSFAHTNSEEHFAYDYATNGNMDKSMDAYAVEGGWRYRLWLVADGYAVENAAMLYSVYDPSERKTDVFAYAEYCGDAFRRRFIKEHRGANLFDKKTMVVTGSWYFWASSERGEGDPVALETNQYTGPYGAIAIPVNQAGPLTISMKDTNLYGYWCVDDGSRCLSSFATSLSAALDGGYTLSVPEGTARILLDIVNYPQSSASGNELMAVYGSEALEYEPYEYYLYFDGIRTNDSDLARIAALETSLGSAGNTVSLKLPERYELVVNDTFELFYKGIVNTVHPEMYDIEIDCTRGAAYGKRYIWTPEDSDVGVHSMTVRLYGLNHALLDERRIELDVKAKVKSPSKTRVVLYVGDSLAVGGHVPAEMKRRLTGTGGTPSADGLTNILFIGSSQDAAQSVCFEGFGGWTWGSYNRESSTSQFMWIVCAGHNKTETDDQHSIYTDANGAQWKLETIDVERIKLIRTSGTTVLPNSGTLIWQSGGVHTEDIEFTAAEQAAGNPFWDTNKGRVDFATYAQRMGVSCIDYIYVLLGWNSAGDAETSYKAEIRTFIGNVLAAFPHCQIVLMGLQLPARDGLGVNYGASGVYSRYYTLMQHVWRLDRWHSELAAEYPGNVSWVNVAGQFDTEHNMPSGKRPVNGRSSTTEHYQTNGVHPALAGYMQIADVAYRDFVHKLWSESQGELPEESLTT